MQTCDFLDALKDAYLLTSDYQVAKKLGVTPSAIGNYRAKRTFFNDEMALKVAELLELDPIIVMACVHAERCMMHAPDNVFNFWADLAEMAMNGRVKMSQRDAA